MAEEIDPEMCSYGQLSEVQMLRDLDFDLQWGQGHVHAKTADELDVEKCNFRNFGSSVTLTLTLDRVEVTLVRIRGRGLPTHQIRWKSEKKFVDARTDVRTPEFQSTRSSVGDDLTN